MELAKATGISQSAIAKWELGKTEPTATAIITLAQFFDVDGDSVHLTAEQQHMLNRWDALTDREKQVIDGMMDIALEKRNQTEN